MSPRSCRLAALAVGSAVALLPAIASPSPQTTASYVLETHDEGMRWHVRARLPIAGKALRMDDSRPFGIAELDSSGWTGLVHSLRVTLPGGETLAVSRAGAPGWRLARPETTVIELDYDVDLAPLARDGWPAPREAAYRDSSLLGVVGRALFVTTAASRACEVEFRLQEGWTAIAPWQATDDRARFRAASPAELVENLVVITGEPASVVRVGDFRVQAVATGWWRAAESRVRRVLERALEHHTGVMQSRGRHEYVVLLLPQAEQGGEAYRGSFALNVAAPPDSGSSGTWGNLIAHELFHQWNGWQLRGADYASSQWFQEGFTEYEANRAMLSADLGGEAGFRDRLAGHLTNARRLTTTLENIGSRKGPPLYSAGALVAFVWDERIRAATADRRSLSDFLREMLRRTDQGARPYVWPDLREGLEATAPGEWEEFHTRFIAGAEPLPVAATLAQLGLTVVESGTSLRVVPDPAASAEAVRRWRRFTLASPQRPR